jgi:hypothetical protein
MNLANLTDDISLTASQVKIYKPFATQLINMQQWGGRR